jgi:gamma-glutamyl-gamma-aminobutyraldehyde dehydrogenase
MENVSITKSQPREDCAAEFRWTGRLNAGTVSINCYSEGEITTPFGGFKSFGVGGRDNGVHAHEQHTELKTILIGVVA